MSLLWADDMSTYGISGQTKMLDGSYAQADGTLVADPDPTSAGLAVFKVATTPPTNGYYLRKVVGANKTTLGMAIRLWQTNLPDTNQFYPGIIFADEDNVGQLLFQVKTTGAIAVYRGAGGIGGSGGPSGTLLGTSTVCLTAGAWHFIEIKALASDTVGTVDIRVNGTSVLSLTGLDTVASAKVHFAQASAFISARDTGSATGYFRDWIFWDTAGSYNNTFFGPVFVNRYTVNADISFNWTASTGSIGYAMMDERGPDDADYTSADSTPPAASIYGVEDLPSNVTGIRGIMLYSRQKKSDGGDCNVKISLSSDHATYSDGADRAITTAFTYWADILEVDTVTGVPWTRTGFNAAYMKTDRTV